MRLEVAVEAGNDGIANVALVGALDADTAPQLEKALKDLDAAILLVVLDMGELEYISSAGLRVIFAATKRQTAKGGELVVRNMSPGVKKVFEIIKALPTMKVFASVEEMDDYLAHFQKKA